MDALLIVGDKVFMKVPLHETHRSGKRVYLKGEATVWDNDGETVFEANVIVEEERKEWVEAPGDPP